MLSTSSIENSAHKVVHEVLSQQSQVDKAMSNQSNPEHKMWRSEGEAFCLAVGQEYSYRLETVFLILLLIAN